jgi:hypothetical protein
MTDAQADILLSIEEEYRAHRRTRDEVREVCELFYRGTIFVSHTSADREWIRENIVSLLIEKYGYLGFFFLSQASPGNIAEAERVLVEYAFQNAKTVLIVLSGDSVISEWVRLEAQWAIDQSHPIILCRRHGVDAARLANFPWGAAPVVEIDFSRDVPSGQRQLMELLHRPEFAPDIRADRPLLDMDDRTLFDALGRWKASKRDIT